MENGQRRDKNREELVRKEGSEERFPVIYWICYMWMCYLLEGTHLGLGAGQGCWMQASCSISHCSVSRHCKLIQGSWQLHTGQPSIGLRSKPYGHSRSHCNTPHVTVTTRQTYMNTMLPFASTVFHQVNAQLLIFTIFHSVNAQLLTDAKWG